jgi:hypothetical protein
MSTTTKGLNKVLQKLKSKKRRMTEEITKIFDETGKSIVIKSKRIVRVDTGRLKKSIHHRVIIQQKRYIILWVGTYVYYSIYVERRYPYLFPSAESEKPILFSKLKRLKI